jgi:hypothetical protein
MSHRFANARILIAMFLLAGIGSSLGAQAAPSAEAQGLAEARTLLEKYKDPLVAVHDGYLSTVACIDIPKAGGDGQLPYKAGGMGVHFFKPATIGPTPDPAQPQVLIYEPVGGKLQLVAAEWFVPLATGVTEPPKLWGQTFDGPMPGHHPIMPEGLSHYDLHVWLFKDNPNGVFHATNPTVSCGNYDYRFAEDAPKHLHVGR